MFFQSPFHRVKGCNTLAAMQLAEIGMNPFNPLFIGSKDATGRREPQAEPLGDLSIPFSSGQRMQRGGNGRRPVRLSAFNPLFIGSKDATPGRRERSRVVAKSFNPLFIGSKDATSRHVFVMHSTVCTFNPLFIGSKDATSDIETLLEYGVISFNPLFIGSKDATSVVLRFGIEHPPVGTHPARRTCCSGPRALAGNYVRWRRPHRNRYRPPLGNSRN